MVFRKAKVKITQKYWNPQKIGESIQGNIFTWLKDKYGNDTAVLECKDEQGNNFKSILPNHQSLMEYYPKLRIGDYILVELIDLKYIKTFQIEKKIYQILIDDNRFKKYED